MRDLTKWPRLLVTGQPVTDTQADEILVRTNSWYLTSNDRAFESAVYETVGIKHSMDQHGFVRVDWDALDDWQQSMGVLDLEYLNNSRILSAWIGGPHGWCTWSGNIGCSNYNLGKWPLETEVHEEWTEIAAAFPYLVLDAQLVPDEGEVSHPAVQWRIEEGKAFKVEPTGLLRPITDPDFSGFFSPIRERGVSLPRLSRAVEAVRASRGVE